MSPQNPMPVNPDLVSAVKTELPNAFQQLQAEQPHKLGAVDWESLAGKVEAALPDVLTVLQASGALSGTPLAVASMVVQLVVTLGNHGVIPSA